MLIILANNPQIFAEGTEVFGEEFGSEQSQPAETPPDEVFTPPAENPTPPAENPTPPAENPTPPAENPTPPVEVQTPPAEEVSTPFEQNESDEDFGDSLNFNNINQQDNPETFSPSEQNENPNGGTVTVMKPPENNSPRINNGTQTPSAPSSTAPQAKLKALPQRFIQVAVDENYIYYLDKQSVAWKKIPYMNSEYMADVWIRMIERDDDEIEREQDTSAMPADLADYVNDTNTDEIALAKAKGYQYTPDDIKVLQHKKYFLERYFLRPKKDQIQFICELEVVGHPQNTASQRKYDYSNWEELIPGSIESILYYSIIQVIGKSKASERGHMTFADMFEEYARISIR